jgi:hypothetical protein
VEPGCVGLPDGGRVVVPDGPAAAVVPADVLVAEPGEVRAGGVTAEPGGREDDGRATVGLGLGREEDEVGGGVDDGLGAAPGGALLGAPPDPKAKPMTLPEGGS